MASWDEPDGTLRIVLIVIAVLVLSPLLLMLVAFPMMGLSAGMWGGGLMGGGMMGGYGGYGGYGVSPFWGLVMPLIWLVVLVGIGYLVYRWFRRAPGTDPALEELRLAYARGEITDEEFDERRSRLGEE